MSKIKLYKDAQQDTYKKLVYDKGLAINSQIKTIRYNLEHFELQTFKSTRFANPTVARDIPIKVLSVDATFKELLNYCVFPGFALTYRGNFAIMPQEEGVVGATRGSGSTYWGNPGSD